MANTPNVPGNIAFQPRQINNSVVELLQRQKQRDEAAAQRYRQSLNANGDVMIKNAERGIEAARMYGEDVKKLTQFSQTLTNFFVEQQEQKNQRDMEEGMALAFTEGVPIEQQTALEQKEAQLSAEDQQTQTAAGKAYEATGSYEVATRVRDLSGWRGYGYNIGRAQIAGSEYGTWLADKINTSQATSVAELQAEVAQWRGEYMKQFSGVPVALLNKYMFPGMRESEGKLIRRQQRRFATQQSDTDTETARITFMGDKMLAPLITRLASTLGPDGEMLGYKKARDAAQRIITEGIRAGVIDADEVRLMGEQEVPASWGLGKGKTFNDLFKTLIQGSIRDATAVERADAEVDRRDAIRQADEAMKQVVEELEANPDAYSPDDIEAIQEEYFNTTSRRSTYLDEYLKNFSADADTKRKQREYLTALLATGRLRPSDLKGIDPSIAIQFRDQATALSKADGAGAAGSGMKDALKSIKTEVGKDRGTLTGESAIDTTTQMIVTELQDKFQELSGKLALGGDPNAVQNALQQTMDYYNTQKDDPKGRYFYSVDREKGTVDNFKGIIQSQGDQAANSLNRIKDLTDKILADKKVLAEPGSVLTKKELEELDKTYGTSEFNIPPIVTYVAEKTGMDPFEIINAQRQALGLDPYESPSAEVVKGMTEEGKQLLLRFKSQLRVRRAFTREEGTFNPATVPYGDVIQQSAATYGVEPGHIAALMEIESAFNPGAVSRTGAIGLMQIQEDAHPNYKGGKDPTQNIDYGTQYYAQLLQQFGDPVHAAGAYNAGPGRFAQWLDNGRPLPAETVEHMRKFKNAYSRYNRMALNDPDTRRGEFSVVQIVSTDPRYANDSDPSTVYDPVGHGGDLMHQHYEFATQRQAQLAKALFERKGFRVTSYIRPGDPGAHGKGYAIDVAPPLDLPRNDQADMAWIDKANAVIGL